MSALAAGELQLEVQDIEIILGLLTPRSTGAKSDTGARSAQAADAARVVSLVRSAHEELQRRHAAREATATAILSLAADALSGADALGEADIWGEKAFADIEATIGAWRGGGVAAQTPVPADSDGIATFIHDLAVDGFKGGHIARAVTLFATLLHLGKQEADALSGLALCGVRLGQFSEALTLASECLNLPVKHPRAYCIAGFCELERGNRKAAQSLLALGARIARKRPEFAEDLRAAQRVLLLLHFS